MLDNSAFFMISIIIPIYNTAPFIERCVNSILNQSYKNVEIVLINDGSTDNSGDICNLLAEKYSNIICIHQKNQGTFTARQTGVSVAKGEWLMFMDSDDTIPSDSIEKLASCISNEYDIIIGAINVNNRTLYKYKTNHAQLNNREYIIAMLQNEINCSPCAKLYRKELFDNINWKLPKNIYQNEDLFMLLNLALNINQKVYIRNDIIGYNYIFRPNSASKRGMMPLDNWFLLFNLIENILTNIKDPSIEKAFLIYRFKILLDFIHTKHPIPRSTTYIHQMIQESKQHYFEPKDNQAVYILKHPVIQKFVHYKFQLILKTKQIIKRIIKIVWKNSPY